MTKLNISIPPELLAEIDAEAEELGLSRSGLIQEASARYIAGSRGDREREMNRLRAQAAARRMKELGQKLGLADADAADLVKTARLEEKGRRG